jgi:hypothetical protein
VFSVTVFTALLGSGFQQQTFTFLWVREQAPASAISFYNSQLTGYTDRTENTASSSLSIVACVSVAAVM